MKRMKTFLIYLILVVGVILLTDVLANLILETNYKDIPYEIITTSPEISISKSEATNANGRINGKITNKNDEKMENVFIKMQALSDIGNVLGEEYIQVGSLESNESKDFELSYRYKNIDSITIETTNEVNKKEIKYHPVVEHAGTIYLIARLITLRAVPPLFFISLFL